MTQLPKEVAVLLAKDDAAFAKLRAAYNEASALNRPGALLALDNATKALKRITEKGTPLPVDWERVEIAQTRGPVLEFTGRRLADTEWQTRGREPMNMAMEIWETRGGALVAVSYSVPADGKGFEDTRAKVVERIEFETETPGWFDTDTAAMRRAVMDHFDWSDRARTMVRKLGWDLRLEIA